jgi:integrase
MGLFRRGEGTCKQCQTARRVETDTDRLTWSGTCAGCGEHLDVTLAPDWWVAFRDPSGRYRRRKMGSVRRDAERTLEDIRVQIRNGTYRDRREEGKHRLGDLLDAWLKDVKPDRRPLNWSREKSCTKHLVHILGRSQRLDTLAENELRRYRLRRQDKEGAQSETVTRELIVLSSALSWAVRRGWIQNRPTIRRPRFEGKREYFLSRMQALALIAACPPYLADLVRAALATGMRRGELLALEWGWVDMGARVISLPAKACKSRRQREVPISSDMIALLRRLHREGIEHHERVLRAPNIARLHQDFREACGRVRPRLDFIRFHDLRHTAASWMVQAGVDLYRVAKILGHRSVEVTQRYSHLEPGHLQEAIQATELGVAQSAIPELSGKIIPLRPAPARQPH